MFRTMLGLGAGQSTLPHRESELYKVLEHHGQTFTLRYGFYDECDRHNRYAEPVVIYPDFLKDPCYTTDGHPFVTAMQQPCVYFEGTKNENSVCEDCPAYRHCEELLGVCSHIRNKKQLE